MPRVDKRMPDWQVLVKQGATHIWRADVQETEDQIGDTVLAKFTIPGVSAREATWYFWSLSTRKEWDGTCLFMGWSKPVMCTDMSTMCVNCFFLCFITPS